MFIAYSIQRVAAIALLAIGVAASTTTTAQDLSHLITPPISRADLPQVLSFALPQTDAPPQGWIGTPPSTVFSDATTVHGDNASVRIERHLGDPTSFSAVTTFIPIDFVGQTVELRGFLRTRDVSDFAGLWIREDGYTSKSLAFDNMQGRHLNGTNEWQPYSIKLPLHPEARQLWLGALLAGSGTVWAAGFQLLIDGKPIWEVPQLEIPKTPFESDREFDAGSGITLDSLTPNQIESLFTLGKVWGFIKYHHPAVTSGQRNWDYDLFRVLPGVLAARDHMTAMTVIDRWIDQLGPIAACSPCATLNGDDVHLRPDLKWISDDRHLGPELSRALQKAYVNRPATGKQFYVSLAAAGNPVFEHELPYPAFKTTDPGLQLLALFRFWNIVEYWSPYRNLIADWDRVLSASIPRLALAKSFDDYQRQLMLVIAAVQDTHANLWSSLALRPPVGECQLPVLLRYVENRFVVTGYAELLGSSGLQIGDAISALDHLPVSKLVAQVAPYYADSNDAARFRDIARSLSRGACGSVAIEVRRDNKTARLAADRVEASRLESADHAHHDLPGDTFQILPQNIAYLKLSSVKADRVTDYLKRAADTKGLIVDIRNYPSEFVVFALGSHLVQRDTPFVLFTEADLSNPGVFRWHAGPVMAPESPFYSGKVVILVDELSQSQAEYTAMALRSTPNAIVMGSATAGADGNISAIALPGNLRSLISGLGVFYPDKKPTQRIGIVPDIRVRPTISGIRAGRDEVLESAVDSILGTNRHRGEKAAQSR